MGAQVKAMGWIENIFEKILWNSRFIVLIAVVASFAGCAAMFFITTVDAYNLVTHVFEYASPDLQGLERSAFRSLMIAHIVELVDGYLLAVVLLIFSLGLYELFISKIDAAEKSKSASNVLLIHTLDDLKARLAKVILMILIVKFFEYAINMQFKTPIDLLYLAAGIALIGLALFLSHVADHKVKPKTRS